MDTGDEPNPGVNLGSPRPGSSSPTPSALSTASSGSPLVRNGSSSTSCRSASAIKRPAPTSIAAAQLQCQQQRHLEFTNKIANGSKSAGLHADSSSPDNWMAAEKKSASIKPAKSYKLDSNNNRLGHKVAKSLAMKANRFNEFWSTNKMRYMNLACLLMTLVCLVTILLFNGTGSSNDLLTKQRAETIGSRRSPAGQAGELAESIDSLDSQALQSQVKPATRDPGQSSTIDDNAADDEFALFDDRHTSGAKLKRNGDNKPIDQGDREVEDQGAGSTAKDKANERKATGSHQHHLSGNSLADPFGLAQMFDEMETGNLFKTLKEPGLEAGFKPIVRRGKNGATIIISSGSLNESNLAESTMPSLLEKLLPPMLRPLTLALGSSSQPTIIRKSTSLPGGGQLSSATITIGGGALDGSGSRLGLFPAGEASSQRGHLVSPLSMMLEPFGLPSRSPFNPLGPLVMPPFMPVSHPSLMSLILRPLAAAPNDDDTWPGKPGTNQTVETSAANKTETRTASQTQNSTSHVNATTSPIEEAASQSEVETFDVPTYASGKLHNLYTSRPRAHLPGSMFIVSSASERLPMESVFEPFGHMLPPPPFGPPMSPAHMLLMNPEAKTGPLSPLLRTILGNIITDLSSAQEEKNNKTNDKMSRRQPMASASEQWADVDDEWDNAPGRQESEASGKQLRARNRADDDSETDASEMIAGFQLGPQSAPPHQYLHQALLDRQPSEQTGGAMSTMSGTIRQTIRGPGMTVERIIELPAQVQQVGPGVRSQSLSRADFGANDQSEGEPRGPGIRSRMIPDEMVGSGPGLELMARHLPEWARRADNQQGRSVNHQLPARSRPSSVSSEDDLDEGDSTGAEEVSHQRPVGMGPKIRLASLRLRIRPMAEPRSAVMSREAVLMPPTHFTMTDNSVDQEHDMSPGGSQHLMRVSPPSSFEDTLNSVEDRLNQVLSMSHLHSSLASEQTRKHGPEQPQSSDGARNKASAGSQTSGQPAIGRQSVVQGLAMPVVDMKQASSALTSPSSPLFGFPVASIKPSGQADDQARKSPTFGKLEHDGDENNRRPRSFTYHSNDELAGPFVGKGHHLGPSEGEADRASPFRMSMLPPPAAIVMGRRLDDGPGVDEAPKSPSLEQIGLKDQNVVGHLPS